MPHNWMHLRIGVNRSSEVAKNSWICFSFADNAEPSSLLIICKYFITKLTESTLLKLAEKCWKDITNYKRSWLQSQPTNYWEPFAEWICKFMIFLDCFERFVNPLTTQLQGKAVFYFDPVVAEFGRGLWTHSILMWMGWLNMADWSCRELWSWFQLSTGRCRRFRDWVKTVPILI